MRDAYFALRDFDINDIPSVWFLRKESGFLANYPQMILPSKPKRRGNLPLLLNLLFCEDDRQTKLKQTMARQPFCANLFL
jgi:hypothetical protein